MPLIYPRMDGLLLKLPFSRLKGLLSYQKLENSDISVHKALISSLANVITPKLTLECNSQTMITTNLCGQSHGLCLCQHDKPAAMEDQSWITDVLEALRSSCM